MIDYSALWVAFAALLVSAFGPCVTAAITCIHENRMYKRRFMKEHAHDAIERYLKAAGKYVFASDFEEMKNFGESASEIFMYAPKELWEDIRKLNENISEHNNADAQHKSYLKPELQRSYLELCEKFSNLDRFSKYKKKRNRRKNN